MVYRECHSGSELVATFIAVLQLCRTGSLIFQHVEDQIVLRFNGTDDEIEQLLEEFEDEV